MKVSCSNNPHRRARSKACTVATRATAWFALLLGAISTPAHAKQWFVQAGGAGLAFSPMVLEINVGDTVTFSNLGGFHNVVADNGSFRCAHGCDGDGMGGNGNATSLIWVATVAFPKAGTFGYFCEPHGAPGEGMFGTIEVRAPDPPVPVPSGGMKLGLILVAALALLAASRLRRGRGTGR
jgi:plastocyanin